MYTYSCFTSLYRLRRGGKNIKNCTPPKKILMTQITTMDHTRWCDHSFRARQLDVWSQVGLRKHHYKQSWWTWWNSSWALSYPKRWYCESAALNMPETLIYSAVATGLTGKGQFSFQSQRKAVPKKVQTTAQLHSFHMLGK